MAAGISWDWWAAPTVTTPWDNRAGERRLLADLTTTALPGDADPAIARRPAQADALPARGDHLRAMRQVTRAYEAG